MSKLILICGSRGMLGASLVPHLQLCGHSTVELSRTGNVGVHADISNAQRTSEVLDEIAPQVIVNLAALANVDECERNPQQAYLQNVRIVENLVGWIHKQRNGCHLIHISTDQVYDGKGPHAEQSITLTNYYGFSKYAGELAAAVGASTVLRTNFFGYSRCAGRLSLSDWLINSLIAADPITVFDDVYFSPLTLTTLTHQIERVVREPQAGVFNLGSREGMSKADFAFAVADALGLSKRTMSRGLSAGAKLIAYRPKDMRMDSRRFEATYGVQLPTLKDQIQSLRAGHVEQTS